ncbi:MAG: hypothetical protein JSW66_03975 [Phycisphaerales bacterium]|nr:MAG: hypothetical protein JSW66_03975 [Phycisphaerales bacterium]
MCKNLILLASFVVVLGLISSASAVDDFESYWTSGDLAQNWTRTGSGDAAAGTRADVTLLTGGYPMVSEGSQAMAIDFNVPGGWVSDDPCDTAVREWAGVTFTPRTPIDLSSFGPDMKFVIDMRVYDISNVDWYLIEWNGEVADGNDAWSQTWIPGTAGNIGSACWMGEKIPGAFSMEPDGGYPGWLWCTPTAPIYPVGEWATLTIAADDVVDWGNISALTDITALESFSIQFWTNARDDGSAYGVRKDADGQDVFAVAPSENSIDIDNIRVIVAPPPPPPPQ